MRDEKNLPEPGELRSCEAIQEKLAALADGELAEADAAIVRAHLAECTACTAVLAETKRILRFAGAWQVEVPEVQWDLSREIRADGLKRVERAEQMAHTMYHSPASSSRRGGGMPTVRKSVGDILLEKKFITQEQLNQAREVQKTQPDDLGRILVNLGYATQRDVVEAKAQSDGVPFIDLTKHKPEPSALNVVPEHVVRKHSALPVKKDGNKLWVAMVDPRNVVATDDIRMVSRCQVAGLAAVPFELEKAIAEAYGGGNRTPPAAPAAVAAPAPGDGAPDSGLHRVLIELQALRREVTGLRSEIAEVRTEVAGLRR